jgi:hypothetical protein
LSDIVLDYLSSLNAIEEVWAEYTSLLEHPSGGIALHVLRRLRSENLQQQLIYLPHRSQRNIQYLQWYCIALGLPVDRSTDWSWTSAGRSGLPVRLSSLSFIWYRSGCHEGTDYTHPALYGYNNRVHPWPHDSASGPVVLPQLGDGALGQ